MNKHTDPVFSKFDTVIIEKGPESLFRYRIGRKGWKDTGYTGEFLVGYVADINLDRMEVTCYFPDNSPDGEARLDFPLRGSWDYFEGQWALPGFLRIKKTDEPMPLTGCQCGAYATYGVGTNLHSDWCKLYKKYK